MEQEAPERREAAPGKEKGYKAMVKEMEGKADKSRVVILFMPPPTKPMEEEMPWMTDDEPQPKFDYSELERTGISGSIQEQKITFNAATKDQRAKPEEKYPIGNHPNFPNRRVYFDAETGFYYELNSTRIGVWSSAMAQNKADVNKPRRPSSSMQTSA
ncbi:hypothetical protein B0H13DRAFT_2305554 [Mycena leptocephala]|nr:hypothetical protein B0H13DRAFT_2305554 [Mycena leptocephala]